ncbi:hypothetical protein AGDE_14895 [Angomonas deanei]|uniref:MORN repeat, putative n=1 Tax=Angomonas deanei TaxID=59799 RepID=A0A7G2CF63_9TRYP|nr:hypothetical protein AGDE_14895 [Angomonas deanei]CAD2218460.1 MORN repeat, putative [Angomonas deanei]|eukprot:EPY20037.1 hypothetical protein AGDE_14895 [Angomonas deanei]
MHSPPSGSLSISHSNTQGEFKPIVVPPNALSLLKGALDEERAAVLVQTLRESDLEVEMKEKRARVELLLKQAERRSEWARLDAESTEEINKTLVKISVAVRDRETTLRPEGYQAFVFANGDLYEGAWKNCRMHGKGFLKREALEDVYEGQWFVGQRYGTGSLYSARFHTFFSGSWLDNRRHGKGEMIEPEGCFVGSFIDNGINGYGEYNYNDGHVYKGEWTNNLYHGSGTYYYPSGAKYEGQWRRGREYGKGAMTFFNGDVYNGDWVGGRPHGYGSYTSSLCQVEGNWRYGTVSGVVTCLFADGTRYRGLVHKDLFHDSGECTTVGGVVYKGGFKDGKREGFGVYSSPNVRYEGHWAGDRKDGEGNIEVRGAGAFEGVWSNDRLTEAFDKVELKTRRQNTRRRLVDISLRGGDDPLVRAKKDGYVPYVEGNYSSESSTSSSNQYGSTELRQLHSTLADAHDHSDQMRLFSPQESEMRVGFTDYAETELGSPHKALKRNISRTLPHLESGRSKISSKDGWVSSDESESEEEEEEEEEVAPRRKRESDFMNAENSTSISAPFGNRDDGFNFDF